MNNIAAHYGVPFPPRSRPQGGQAGRRSARARTARGAFDRLGQVFARFAHADRFAGDVRRALPLAHHQHSPLFSCQRFLSVRGPTTRRRNAGWKLIGATAHYVTEELDEGPIIEQDVVQDLPRRDAVEDLVRKGRDPREGRPIPRGRCVSKSRTASSSTATGTVVFDWRRMGLASRQSDRSRPELGNVLRGSTQPAGAPGTRGSYL